jgi:tRNA (adenine57-N1/adenine58-N1)-methyltransferase
MVQVAWQVDVAMASSSPFLEPGTRSKADNLAIILLSRDNYQPITLEQSTGAVDGYAEGTTLNTRFGSFPHSTLLNVPWGSQIRASVVDTGSRGKKRRREAEAAAAATGEDTSTPGPDDDESRSSRSAPAKAVTASSGFVHILRPTPELWTSSLPHRTQVVYTPDYSYILSRIRARPGTRLIEAGAGSGSFTHASVRAVYNGVPTGPGDDKGKVFSYEFNEARYHTMQEEIKGHSLEDMVRLTHRNVYKDGFLVDGESPRASAIFLDLPAPWEALRHLSRRKPLPKDDQDQSGAGGGGGVGEDAAWVSPLDPSRTVHICTFSPCIEQVMQTVTDLRKLGWVEIDMVEIAHKRINVLRDRGGVNVAKDKNFNPPAQDVKEALAKLRQVGQKTQDFIEKQGKPRDPAAAEQVEAEGQMDVDTPGESDAQQPTNGNATPDEKPWLQGRIIHRPEVDLKTHTSYLVFAVLPREWTEEDEAAAFELWPCGKERKTIGSMNKAERKQEKRDMIHARKKQKLETAQARNGQAAAPEASGETGA